MNMGCAFACRSHLHNPVRFVHNAVFFAEIQSLLVNFRDAHAISTQAVSTQVTFSTEHRFGQQATGNTTGCVSGRRSRVQTCIGSRWASGPARTGYAVVAELPVCVRKCVHECGAGQHRFYESSKLLRIELRPLPIRDGGRGSVNACASGFDSPRAHSPRWRVSGLVSACRACWLVGWD